jgi:putative DNA primase/helicase
MMRESKIDKVKALVQQRGGWRCVYSAYPNLLSAFDRKGKEVSCPKSGAGKTKFSFFKDADIRGAAFHRDEGGLADGIDVIAWYENVSKSQAMDIIIGICGGDLSSLSTALIQQTQQTLRDTQVISAHESAKRKANIDKIWSGVKAIQGTKAETYLRSRGIKGDPASWNNLFFHDSLAYKEDDETPWTRHPGMLAIVRDTDCKSLTLHRTFLADDGQGKANVSRQKMMMAQPRPLKGACIRIDQPVETPAGKLIGIAEGIETALSIREATGCPMWIGISDRIMEQVVFPEDVKFIIVWADIEPSGAGLRAAETLRSIWEPKGVKVIVEAPHLMNRDKADWNDVYQEIGTAGFGLTMQPEYRVYTGVEVA